MKSNFDKLYKTKFNLSQDYEFTINDYTFTIRKLKHKLYYVFDNQNIFYDWSYNKTHLLYIVKQLVKEKGGVINGKKEN